jgi:D-alanine-D-alanine ligase
MEDHVRHERRIVSREAIKSALEEAGHAVQLIEANDSVFDQLRTEKPDIAFNIYVGRQGESQQALVPCILEKLGLPYTGSGPLAHSVALDKPMTKRILQAGGIPTPRFQVFSPRDDVDLDPQLTFPLFIKPAGAGCSAGITEENLVHSETELARTVRRIIRDYHQPAIVEEFLGGREFTVGILGNDSPRAFPLLEVDFGDVSENPIRFRTFGIKMLGEGHVKSVCPAPLEPELATRVKQTALATYEAVGCRDFARVDTRLDEQGMPQVLEVNSLPGLTPEASSYTIMALADGLPFHELTLAILTHACKRYGIG